MRDLELWSGDRRFGLRVEPTSLTVLLKACVAAGRRETGGILIGTYSAAHDCAIVRRVTGPTADSRFGTTWFFRGATGLQRLLNRHWRRGTGFYLGEWHFHPFAPPTPSGIDIGSMRGIADSPLYNCPEPVLLIIGGNPQGRWAASATVFPRGGSPVTLDSPVCSD